jgi:hypothetical protein
LPLPPPPSLTIVSGLPARAFRAHWRRGARRDRSFGGAMILVLYDEVIDDRVSHHRVIASLRKARGRLGE